jgi:hypothetical protein
MILFRRGKRKKFTHRNPRIWRPQAPDKGNTVIFSFLDTPRTKRRSLGKFKTQCSSENRYLTESYFNYFFFSNSSYINQVFMCCPFIQRQSFTRFKIICNICGVLIGKATGFPPKASVFLQWVSIRHYSRLVLKLKLIYSEGRAEKSFLSQGT